MGVAAALTPRVRLMAICDAVRKSKTEIGVFDLKGLRQSISAPAFPFALERLWLFSVLSSPRFGRFPGYVRIVHERTDKAVLFAHLNPSPEFEQGVDIFSARVKIRCRFPEPGKYTVQIWFFQPSEHDVLKGEIPLIIEMES